jgi:hypothetical protein
MELFSFVASRSERAPASKRASELAAWRIGKERAAAAAV